MYLAPEQKTVLFPYTGLGGAVLGMQQAGWAARYGIGVEVLHDRCKTLRSNFPDMRVAEARIEDRTLASYGLREFFAVLNELAEQADAARRGF